LPFPLLLKHILTKADGCLLWPAAYINLKSEVMKKVKKLSLNKEVISSLQEKQMRSLMGGAALASKGKTSANTCDGQCTVVSLGSTICHCMPEAVEETPPSCCQNSCN
jgi:natural product precursor